MNIKVMYHSKTGNTKKLAESMAGTLGVQAEAITGQTITQPVDLLFLGDGVYAGGPDPATVKFISTLNSSLVKNAAVYGTYGGQTKAITTIQELLRKQGINVIDENFGCRGRCWGIFNRKHPNTEDIQAASEFAKRTSAI